jgi:class 3 adenylate cyclase
MAEQDDITITITHTGRQPLTLLLSNELIVGRECEGLIVPDSEVSRRHLRLRRRGRAVEVTDLDSTNGTMLNGVALEGSELIDSTGHLVIGATQVVVDFRSRPSELGSGRTTKVRSDEDLRRTTIDLVADAVSSQGSGPDAPQWGDDTITILFSDIEASTERASSMGDAAWFQLLEEHNRLFRFELARWGGEEVKSMGDGFMLTFPSVSRALRFATAVQRRVASDDGPDVRVRMGIHTGEAITDPTGDLFGRHVILAARVANLAEGGQVLASLVVREIAAGQDDFVFGEPVLAELKGFLEPHPVYELLWSEG